MITFPDKIYSEAELIEMYNNSYSKWINKNKQDGTPLSKTRVPRTQQTLFAPFTRKTPDGYYVAMDGDILAGWVGWGKVSDGLFLTMGSFTAPDYRRQGIQPKLWGKREKIFANSAVMTITNKKEKGWVDYVSRYYNKVSVDELPKNLQKPVQEALDFYDKQGNNPFVFYRGPTEDNAMEKAWGIIKMR
tara:strand:+ start:4496 stop:5062 length:567 start_codon:yes stop_codon:yes gene_type:complete